MWPFESKAVTQEEETIVTTHVNYPSPDYGDTLGHLTRFGSAWLNLNEIYALDFETGDGCDCEVTLANGKTMHLDERSAVALSDYISKH